jgi:enoyl-CoA hydratase/carnithine racemase
VDIGMAADLGTLQLFPQRVGNQSTFKELAFTGRYMKAAEALQIGFVSRILEDRTQLEAALMETAQSIAAKSPVGVYTLKQTLNKGESRLLSEGLDYIARMNQVMLQTKDMGEAVSAFMTKTKPQFPKL